MHHGVNGTPLGEDSDLFNQIKGMYQCKPSKKALVSNWSLPLVPDRLNKPPFEPLETADIKFFKTVFLVAVASGRRVSGIHALSA